jgi:hypothetical protein
MSRPTRLFRSDLSYMRERSYLMRSISPELYMVGSMLITRFMLGEAGISCLEMPGEAMNLNIVD